MGRWKSIGGSTLEHIAAGGRVAPSAGCLPVACRKARASPVLHAPHMTPSCLTFSLGSVPWGYAVVQHRFFEIELITKSGQRHFTCYRMGGSGRLLRQSLGYCKR